MYSEKQLKAQLTNLLGFILLMEQKIEMLKQELAGHDEFDTRVAFQTLDLKNKGYIVLQDMSAVISGMGSALSLDRRSPHELQSFFKRYGNGERITYTQFLREIRPKMHTQLAQSLVVRNLVRRHLPDHVRQKFQLLVAYYLLLSSESQRLRMQIQTQLGLNFLQVFQLTKVDMHSQAAIQNLFRQNGDTINKHQARYLINHTRDMRDFSHWTEQQFKEIFSPIDSLRSFEPREVFVLQSKPMNTQPQFRHTVKDNYLGIKFSRTAYNQSNQSNPYPLIPSRMEDEVAAKTIREMNQIPQHTFQTDREAVNPPQMKLQTLNKFMLSNQKVQPEVQDTRSRPTVQKLQLTLLHQPQIDKFMKVPGQPYRQQFSDDLEQSLKSAFRYHQ